MKLAPEEVCTACMACIDICPRHALDFSLSCDGFYQIDVKKDVCIDCGLCEKTCPQLKRNTSNGESFPFAACAKDEQVKKRSASGGIFGAMALKTLENGGVVYGAAIERFEVRHIRIVDKADLYRIQGSKYQHSILKNIYCQVRKDLREGRQVLFGGLGCQIVALLSFLGNTNRDKLILVDMICGGLSTMLPIKNLEETGKYNGIRSFRDKEQGWKSFGFKYSLKMIDNKNQIVDLGLDNMVLNTFSSKLLKRSSCLDCHYNGFHRLSDFTIGDFWGDKKFSDFHKNGLSVLIVHNINTLELIKKCGIKITPISWTDFVPYNHNLYWTRYKMIRFLPMRYRAFSALRNKQNDEVMKMIGSWTFPGILLRIYLKINSLFRTIFYIKNKPV